MCRYSDKNKKSTRYLKTAHINLKILVKDTAMENTSNEP